MSIPVLDRLDEYSNLENNTERVMTISGTLTAFALLSVVLLIPAVISWNWAALGFMDRVNIITMVGAIVGFILAIIICINPKNAPFLSPLYAVCEGALLGGLSAILEMQFRGIVMQAVAATFLVTFIMFTLFKTKVIQVTKKFVTTLLVATGSIALLYILNFIMNLCGFNQISQFLWSSSPLSILVSFLFCGVAAFNLILDFYNIEKFSEFKAPKYMEWFCAFGLMVTIVWLYIELLRLLSKFNR